MFQIFLFSKKNPFLKEKNAKNCKKMQYSQKPNNYRFFALFSLQNEFFFKTKFFWTFKCIILHLFCNTLFFVSWSLKFDFGFWLNLPVQICTIWNISILGFGPVWGFQWTNLQVQGAIFSVITRTKKIWKKKYTFTLKNWLLYGAKVEKTRKKWYFWCIDLTLTAHCAKMKKKFQVKPSLIF